MTIEKTDEIKRELSAVERQATKKAFVEPEISTPLDALEATAFFQVIVGPTDVAPDVTP